MIKNLNQYLNEESLKLAAFTAVFLWLLFQMYILGIFWGVPQASDAGIYQEIAIECYSKGKWYPMTDHILNSQYIFNPGYINFLILQLKIFGTLELFGLFNLLLNIVLLSSVYCISKRLISKKSGYVAVVLFCMMPSNVFSASVTMTETLVVPIVYGACAMVMSRKLLPIVLAGSLFVFAEYVRPSAMLFLPAIFLYFFAEHFSWKKIAALSVSLIVSYTILVISVDSLTEGNYTGTTTKGTNLIMGANDDMTGTYDASVFEYGKQGYLEGNYNVFQKDSVLTKRALSWIKAHPLKYISFIPRKLYHLYWHDDYWYILLQNKEAIQEYKLTKSPVLSVTRTLLKNFSYYVMLMLFFFSLWKIRKQLVGRSSIFLIPVILNTLMIALTVGGPRYHFICSPIMIVYSTIAIVGVQQYNKKWRHKDALQEQNCSMQV